MFSNAVSYPKSGTDAAKTILIGGLLTLLGVFVVPLILVTGYVVRVVRAVADNDDQLPEFTDWRALFVDGLKGTVIGLAYFVAPALLFGALVAAVALVVSPDAGVVTAALAALPALAFSVVVWYVATAAFVNFAVTGRFRAAFEFAALRPILSSGAFATAWLVGLAVLVLASVVGSVIAMIPILGLASAFVAFYGTVAAAYCYARGFADSVPVAPTPEAPAADPAA